MPSARQVLQRHTWSDPHGRFSNEQYWLASGDVVAEEDCLTLCEGATICFAGYQNSFDLGLWQKACALRSLFLGIKGQGRVRVQVFADIGAGRHTCLASQLVSLSHCKTIQIDIPTLAIQADHPILFCQVTAIGPLALHELEWSTQQPAVRDVSLAICMTTYKREDSVQAFITAFDESDMSRDVSLIVVDNGQSLKEVHKASKTVLHNRNMGGSGGFARCLLEANTAGFSHVIFMDDDASCSFEAIRRSLAFFRYVVSEKAAVMGAMATLRTPDILWESGAHFDGMCRPHHQGTQLTSPNASHELFRDPQTNQPGTYGGWWFFAFSLSEHTSYPFPFFVRGDDVSFSIKNRFELTTLPGVISVQEGFNAKESPMTQFLDARSHLAHVLTFPNLNVGRLKALRCLGLIWSKAILSCHYRSANSVTAGIMDTLRGPKSFTDAPNATKQRTKVANASGEDWCQGDFDGVESKRIDGEAALARWALKLTLNGHLLPGFRKLGNKRLFLRAEKGRLRDNWGIAQATYFDDETGAHYVVRHNKWAFVTSVARFLVAAVLLLARFKRLQKQYQAAYPTATSAAYWRDALGVGPSEYQNLSVQIRKRREVFEQDRMTAAEVERDAIRRLAGE